MNDNLGILAFLCVFEILGGAGLGVGLRGLLGLGLGPNSFFFLIWGTGFGGIPLLIGALLFLPEGSGIYFVAQAFIFFLAVVVAMLAPEPLFAGSKDGTLFGLAVAGAVLTLLGGAIVLLTLQEGINPGLFIGGFMGVLGAWLLFGAVQLAFRTTR